LKLGGAINDVINTLIPLFTETLGPAFADLSNTLSGVFNRIWSVVGPILGLIGGAIIINISNAISIAVEAINTIFEVAVYAFDSIVNALQPLITAIKSALGMDGAIGEGVDAVEVLQSIMSGFSDIIGAVFDVITKLGKIIIDVFVAHHPAFKPFDQEIIAHQIDWLPR
jgi:phage-related protein